MALKQRLISGVLMGGGALCGLFLLPPVAVPVVFVIIGLLVMLEFYALLDASQLPHFKWVGTFGGLALLLGTWLTVTGKITFPGAEPALLYLVVAACFLRSLFHVGGHRAWETTAGTLLGLVYGAFLLNFMQKLLIEWNDAQGRYLLLFLIVTVKLTDIGAYFTGCSIGRHKLIPRISPAKTWEGCAGGVVAAVIGALVVSYLLEGRHGVRVFPPVTAAIVGVLLAVSGILGDLIESLFKRASGVKDSGHIIRGMGGILDVLDSLLFTAPVLYIAARLVLPP